MLHELIELFLEKIPKVVAQIGDALGSADYETIKQRSHTLKGSMGLLCAQHAYNAAIDLEQCAARGIAPECELQFAGLKEEIDELHLALASITRPRVRTVARDEE